MIADLSDFEAALAAAHAKRKAKPKAVREAKVEAAHRDDVRDQGGESYKFTSPGRRAVPDRLDLFGVDRMVPVLRAILSAYGAAPAGADLRRYCADLLAAGVRFTECKKPGAVPTAAQEREHAKLRALGFAVDVLSHVKPSAPRNKVKQPLATVPTYEELFG